MNDQSFLWAIAVSVMIGAFAFGLWPKTRRGLLMGFGLLGLWVLGFGALELITRGLNAYGTSLFFFGAATLGGVGGLIGLGTQTAILRADAGQATAIRLGGIAVLSAAFALLFWLAEV